MIFACRARGVSSPVSREEGHGRPVAGGSVGEDRRRAVLGGVYGGGDRTERIVGRGVPYEGRSAGETPWFMTLFCLHPQHFGVAPAWHRRAQGWKW